MTDVTILVEPIESDVTIEVSEVKNGADGVGLPTGGATGQVPIKQSATDYDVAWGDVSSGGNLIHTNFPTQLGIPNNNISFSSRLQTSNNLASATVYGINGDILSVVNPPTSIAYAKGNLEISKLILISSLISSELQGYTATLSVMKGKFGISGNMIDVATILLKDFIINITNSYTFEFTEADMLDNSMEDGDHLFWAIRCTQNTGTTRYFYSAILIPIEK